MPGACQRRVRQIPCARFSHGAWPPGQISLPELCEGVVEFVFGSLQLVCNGECDD
jgi:hypothetical protein